MLPNTAHTQLQAVQQDIKDVKAELYQVKQDLAKAKSDNDNQEVDFLRKRVEAMDKQLSSLREKDNILLRDLLGGQHCFLPLLMAFLPVCCPVHAAVLASSVSVGFC